MIGNHKPVLRNVDEAARRRFNVVPFVHKPAKPDPDLEAKLKAEWPGILRWAIDGCLQWQNTGLVRPASVQTATGEYFAAQDLFGQWLDDECDADPGNGFKRETSADPFAPWKLYATNAGATVGSQNTFCENMERRGFERYRTQHGRGFTGLRLKVASTREGTDR